MMNLWKQFNVIFLCSVWIMPVCHGQRLHEHTHKKRKMQKAATYSRIKNYNLSFLDLESIEGDLDFDFVEGANNYLFIMAIDKYKYWKSLKNAVKDAQDFKKVLIERYGFKQENIYELLNEEASPEAIKEHFEILKNKGTNVDNLIIYYSGHGYYDSSFDLGYWVPSNGKTSSGATSSYIPNDHIRDYIKELNFRHIFLVADACFSGSLFLDARGENFDTPESVKSRWGLSSGNLELVSDGQSGGNSPFAGNLINYLNENLQDKLRVDQLIDYVVNNVKESTEQEPQGKPLNGVDHEGGVFFFTLEGTKEVDPNEGNEKKVKKTKE